MWLHSSLGTGCCSSEKPLKKTPLPPSKQKIPGTCLRNSNNLHVSNVWFCTKLHTVTFQERKLLCTFVQSCKVSIRALKYEFGFCRLQKGCGCDGAYLTVLGSFLMSSFSIYWVFKMSEKYPVNGRISPFIFL